MIRIKEGMGEPSKAEDLNPTRPSLLDAVKNWDNHDAWKAFVDTYSTLIFSVAFKAGLTSAEAEDVRQETLFSVAKEIRKFNYNPALGKFRNWLIRNTMWRVLDQLKKRKNACQPSAKDDVEDHGAAIEQIPDPSGDVINQMCEEEWAKHLVQLALEKVKRNINPKHFQIYELYVLQQMAPARVAELCGIVEGNVYTIKNRVGKLVQEEISLLNQQSI